MSKTRTGDPFMSAHEYGRNLPKFSINLLVHDIETSLNFYRDVLGATVRYSDGDFAALSLSGLEFMLHADHAYDNHPLHPLLQSEKERGVGAELRFLGLDPDQVAERATRAGSAILQPPKDFPHGWRELTLRDPDGYIWTVGVAIPAVP